MKIKQLLQEHRNDFSALMECEHCGAVQMNGAGYHDNHYHTRVIPAMHCATCFKNRAGEIREDGGTSFVPDPNNS